MVKIRLKRMGAKKKPFYRVVVADSRAPRDGKFIEELGYYDPMVEPNNIKIDSEKAQKWLGDGAQPPAHRAPLPSRQSGPSPGPQGRPAVSSPPPSLSRLSSLSSPCAATSRFNLASRVRLLFHHCQRNTRYFRNLWVASSCAVCCSRDA